MTTGGGFHLSTIRVKYAEPDRMGLAYNGHYLTWFEVGRTELLRDNGLSYFEMEQEGFRLPLIEADVKYLKPALYDDVLTIKTHLGEKPGLRVRIHYEIWRMDDKLATGFTEHVFTDENLKPKRPSKKIVEKMMEIWDKQMRGG